MPEKLSIDDARELLSTLTRHSLVENSERQKNGLDLKRFFICPACEEVSTTPDDCLCVSHVSEWGV